MTTPTPIQSTTHLGNAIRAQRKAIALLLELSPPR
jgi:hypothetical protein